MNISRMFRKIFQNATSNEISLIHIRNKFVRYSSWNHRKPSKVIFPESEVEDEIENVNNERENKKSRKYNVKSFKMHTQKAKVNSGLVDNEEPELVENEISDDENAEDINYNLQSGTTFKKLLNSDPTLSQLMLKVKSSNTRKKFGKMMLEGKRLNQDAILAGLIPQDMFFTRPEDVENLSMPSGVVKLYKVTYKVMRLWTSVQTAPGLVGFYDIPKPGEIKENPNSLPLTVICDNIRDPGNAGAILRTAAGVGLNKVLFMKGCADVWDSKVLRAGSGGHFRVPLEQNVEWDDINYYLDVNTSVLLADNREKIKNNEAMSSCLPLVPYHSVNFSAFSSIGIVIGGETEGLSKQAVLLSRYRNGVRLHIPLDNEMDSLNTGAALSVILFEIKRQLGKQENEEIYFQQ